MKKALLLLSCLVICVLAQAQPKYTFSEGFDEPDAGWTKLIQLKNGNTIFFHFSKRKGIQATIYDKNHSLKSEKIITGNQWDERRINASTVKGLYEINGQPVIFLQQEYKGDLGLFRICLNPNTAAVEREDLLGTLPRMGMFANMAVAMGNAERNDFIIEKDASSDGYGIVFFHGFAHKREERIHVVHYNGKHEVLTDMYYNSPNGKFKYLVFIGMTVDNDKNLYLATYGYNTEHSGGKDSRIIISRIKPGEKDFTDNLLDFSHDFSDTRAVMQYNPGSHMIQLLTLTYESSKSNGLLSTGYTTYYFTRMTYIDPSTLDAVFSKTLTGEKINSYAHDIGLKHAYDGLPQQMIINNDNTTTVLFEELTTLVQRDSRGRAISVHTLLGSIGISELNETGVEKNGYAILKEQKANGYVLPLYIANKSKGQWYRPGHGMYDNNEFLSFDYANTDKNRYIIFNDYAQNYDKEEGERNRKTVKKISKSNAICYKLEDGKLSKFYLFGEPKSDDASIFCNLESSCYLKETHTYASIVMDREGKDKQARIAWVTFE